MNSQYIQAGINTHTQDFPDKMDLKIKTMSSLRSNKIQNN